ncbi:hypothetical protein LRM64_10055 [Prescottella equi]|uniref:hypothetical protein n=1 Tax=Rhodococcus hoagii TaxID=43767 RepID=UPI0019DF7DAA|nr:hypothetical protein [Prescottella equi]MBM4592242.1 hypothetical protein [Prescottella equi]MCU7531889.1 hypothetical protein [Prescottella equi]MCU7534021.1 hypothetical protein [Prescottella equi]NKW13273.1 hypothetical protein [Prescottella equi]
MIAVAISVGLLALVAAACGVVLYARRLRIRCRVLVSLKSGNGVSGVIVRSSGNWIVVADAMVLDRDASAPTPADGEIWVERANVDFVQAIGGDR